MSHCLTSRICLKWVKLISVQQQLNSSLDDETAAFLHDCYTLEEKERLKEEWRLFEEQKRNFEKERKNFTEAAIRLGREVCKSLLFCARLIECKTLECLFFLFHRKRPSRRTELLGWRISFWAWLRSETAEDVLRLTDKVPYQLVSLCSLAQISSPVFNWISVLLLAYIHLCFRKWARDENVFYKCSAHHIFKLCCNLHS